MDMVPLPGAGLRIHRSTTEQYSARFFNYLIWWVRVTVYLGLVFGVGLGFGLGLELVQGLGLG